MRHNTSTLASALVLAFGISFGSISVAQLGQSQPAGQTTPAGALAENFPELANLFNAQDVVQAQLFEAMAAINSDPATVQTRMDLKMELDMMNDMAMRDHLAMGHGGNETVMSMTGPFGELEIQARVQMATLLQRDHSGEAAVAAIENTESLPVHARRVLFWGQQFERQIRDIYADGFMSLAEKRQAVADAVVAYRTGDEQHAVSLTPKNASLYLSHDYANGAKTGFPRLSSLLWINQWLQLAAMEAIIVAQLDSQFAGRVPVTLERYWNKVGSETGMTMFPVPNEMPSVPAIAPSLYSEAPQVAVILDNLNMLEAAIADILAYPNVENRDELLAAVATEFTVDSANITDEMNYLLSALRGGIFNQGGPAIGDLTGSERNRSRSAMNMRHSMIMSSPQ